MPLFKLLSVLALRLAAAGPSPKALLINLPRHEDRYRDVKMQLQSAGIAYERAEAVDGKMLSKEDLKANVTRMARWFLTRGMIGCFLSHRYCWQRCIEAGGPILVFEDDVVLADNFTAALSDALAALPEDWDVLLLGALGAVHPLYYGVNAGHALLAGGCRYPRGAAKAFGRDRGGGVAIHTPLRPFGTHAYALSERGAKKLLAAAPRASYHVDVIAWGLRRMKLFAVHPLLAKQTHDDTTIGGHSDRSWLPNMVIDQYTGTDFAWAWNAPLMQIGPLLVTSGRAFFMTFFGLTLSWVLRSHPLLCKALLGLTVSWVGLLYMLLTLLTWPQPAPPPSEPRAAEPIATSA
jgi:glycosyl transferase family 25